MARIDDFDNPPSPDGKEVLVPSSRGAWRSWLASNEDRRDGLWIVYRKKTSRLDGPVSGGLWSAVNKDRIARLTASGQMAERGHATIDEAKAGGSWSRLDDDDARIVP